MLFENIRPRGYHHKFIYVDERKEFLESLGSQHDTAAGADDIEKKNSPHIVRPGMFSRRDSRAGRFNGAVFYSSLAVLFIMLCFVAWLYML